MSFLFRQVSGFNALILNLLRPNDDSHLSHMSVDESGDDEDEQEKVERKRVTKRDRKAKRSYSRYRHGGRRGTRDG